MKLYILRHGPAEDDSATRRDFDRALTPSGRDRVRAVAAKLVADGELAALIVTSPLVRADETARILRHAFDEAGASASGASGASGGRTGFSGSGPTSVASVAFETRDELAGNGAAKGLELVAELSLRPLRSVMLVGHQPDLSEMILELTGRSIAMDKAMVVAIDAKELAHASHAKERQATTGRTFGELTLRFVLDPKTLAYRAI